LPRTLVDEAARWPKGSPRAAVQMQLAVAIEILLKAPMRSINLIGLRLDRHILRPRGPGGVVHVRLDATETKAKRAQEFELAGESRILFDRYLAAFRPILADVDCPFLFPGADRRTAKAQSTLAKQIVDAIARHVGVHMTIHQFRHFCAALLLEWSWSWSWSCPGLVDSSGAFGVGRLCVGPFVLDGGLVSEGRVTA
jgi:integrase